jgi:DNA-binding PadR family transcriptional regulator
MRLVDMSSIHVTVTYMKNDVTTLLMLAMIEKAGIDSFYAMRKATALVPGVLLLRLKQLSSGGAVRTGKSGGRGKKGLTLTPKGRTMLEHDWRPVVEDALDEPFDAVLKAFWLTRLMDGQDPALALMDRAYDARHKEARRLRDFAHEIDTSNPLQAGYAYLQAQAQPARLETEAAMFRNLAEILGQQRSEW